MKGFILAFCFLFLTITQVYGTHNRAGEITYEQIAPLTIRIKITTYTKTSSQSADRDSLEVFWGDGTKEFVSRTNGGGDPLANDVKVNYYIEEHTYPGRSTYTVGFTDPNRIASILNVNWPNSVEVQFFLSTTFTFLDPQFQGSNSSAILLQAPIDQACAGKRFTHNPNAYDVDGDSLSYELIAPLMGPGEDVPGYQYPDQISPGANNSLTIDSRTGDLVWDVPQLQGEYNIAIRINEYRKGILLNSIIRDMQVFVSACDNDPPILDVVDEICVIAGEVVDLDILVDDINDGQQVILTYTGGPFEVENNKAIITNSDELLDVAFTAHLKWETTCNHISREYYQVVLKAKDENIDSGSDQDDGLATLKSIRIKVVGPAPENLVSESIGGNIDLSWDKPYSCDTTDNQFFRGFSVWRKIGNNVFQVDSCSPGLSGKGYEKIIFSTTAFADDRYIATDNNVEKGITYCYRVQAEFGKLTDSGNPFNKAESLSSDEVCQQLARDLPLIVKNSINVTDSNNGSVDIHWTKPIVGDLDTLENPGPYRYELFRSLDEGLTYQNVTGFTINTVFFSDPIDTTYIDTGINTLELQPYYKMDFYSGGALLGTSSSASSVYLELIPSDKNISLEWSADVPWSNVEYEIYKENQNGVFDLLVTTTDKTYKDINLINGESYCYYIKSVDSYGLPMIDDPLINYSQESCTEPYDDISPCAPLLSIINICDEDGEFIDIEENENLLSYEQLITSCPEDETIASYNIYYSPSRSGAMIFVENVIETEYIHIPVVGLNGCYTVTSLDENGNESEPSEIVCAESCPLYELPNTFTPNNDGTNEIFKPRKNRFIEQIDFNVFNEWGNKIYSTEDPAINWDGTDLNGIIIPEGTYFYTCRVFESRQDGLLEGNNVLSGFIHIIR